MPPLPDVPQVLKIKLQGNSGETQPVTWANVLHFAYTGSAPSAASCTTIAGDVGAAWNSHMGPECVNNVAMNVVTVTDLTSSTAGAGASFTSYSGSRGDDEIPANVAFLVDYPIPRRYRGGHPRQYLLVGGNADFLDAAHWSTAFTAEVATHWTAFLDAVLAISVAGCSISNLVNVSYYGGVPTVDGKSQRRTVPLVDVINIATMVAEQQMASQRRRIGRHRR